VEESFTITLLVKYPVTVPVDDVPFEMKMSANAYILNKLLTLDIVSRKEPTDKGTPSACFT